jgi:hypothetical protein
MAVDQRRIAVPDIVFAGAGLLAIISTFLPWWSASTVGASVTVNGWNSASDGGTVGRTIAGPLVWLPMLILLVWGALALVRAFAAPHILPGKVFYQAGIAVGGLAAVLVVIRWLTLYKFPAAAVGYSSGAGLGLYLGLICGLAVAGVAIWGMTLPAAGAAQTGAFRYGGQPGQFGGYPQPFPQQQYGQPPFGQPMMQPPYGQLGFDPAQQQYGPPQPQYGRQPQYGQPMPQPYPPQPYGQPGYDPSQQQPQYAQPPQQPYGQPQPYPQPPQDPSQQYGQPPQFGQPPQGQQPPPQWQ